MSLPAPGSPQPVLLAPSATNANERINKDLIQVKALVADFEQDLGDSRGSVLVEQKRASLLAAKGLTGTEDDEAIQDIVGSLTLGLENRKLSPLVMTEQANS